jgi:hypothetical protein
MKLRIGTMVRLKDKLLLPKYIFGFKSYVRWVKGTLVEAVIRFRKCIFH